MKKKVRIGFAGQHKTYMTFYLKERETKETPTKKKKSIDAKFSPNILALSINAEETAIRLGLVPDNHYTQVVTDPKRFRKKDSYIGR